MTVAMARPVTRKLLSASSGIAEYLRHFDETRARTQILVTKSIKPPRYINRQTDRCPPSSIATVD
jgi:hypothetical protein